jgi:hypothetical protein
MVRSNAYLRHALAQLSQQDRKIVLNKNWPLHNKERLELLDKEDVEGLDQEEALKLERLQTILDLRRAISMRLMMKIVPLEIAEGGSHDR